MRQITTDILTYTTETEGPLVILAPESAGEARIMHTAMVAAAKAMGTMGVAGPHGRAQGWTVSLDYPGQIEIDGDGWAGVSLYITDANRTQPDLCAQMFVGGEDATAAYTISILCRMAYTDRGGIVLHITGDIPDELHIQSRYWIECGLPLVELA